MTSNQLHHVLIQEELLDKLQIKYQRINKPRYVSSLEIHKTMISTYHSFFKSKKILNVHLYHKNSKTLY